MSQFTYAAHTEKAIFYLDEEGVCQDLEAKSGVTLGDDLLRCVGSQYVASLDMADASGLVSLPRAGASMLFVVADARMRFSLVRTGVVVRFETLGEAPAAKPALSSVEEARREKAIKATLELVAEGDSTIPPPPDVRVAWPSADVLARAMLVPPSAFKLMAPPPPRRAAAGT
ncbi:MAG: hypothetical protein U0235_05445 [Polyangiaceae bacterium]